MLYFTKAKNKYYLLEILKLQKKGWDKILFLPPKKFKTSKAILFLCKHEDII